MQPQGSRLLLTTAGANRTKEHATATPERWFGVRAFIVDRIHASKKVYVNRAADENDVVRIRRDHAGEGSEVGRLDFSE